MTLNRTAPAQTDLELALGDRLMRRLFRISQKDKNLKKLSSGVWRAMPTCVEGLNFELYPADNSTERNLYVNRQLEEKDSLLALEQEVAGKRCLIYDIGANCGLYSIFLSRIAGPESQIHAFEPSPAMGKRLRNNLQLNTFANVVEVHAFALSSERGTAHLNVHNRNHGQSSLCDIARSEQSIAVQMMPLADFYSGHEEFDLFVIKIDVEGHEDDVLHPFISSCESTQLPDMIMLEMVMEQQWKQDIRQLLLTRGYRITFEGDGNALFKLADQ